MACDVCGSPDLNGRAYGCLYALHECGIDECSCMGAHQAIMPARKCSVVRSEEAKAEREKDD